MEYFHVNILNILFSFIALQCSKLGTPGELQGPWEWEGSFRGWDGHMVCQREDALRSCLWKQRLFQRPRCHHRHVQ